MARYIDADKLIEVLKEHRDYYAPNLSKITNEAMSCGLSIAIKETKNAHTADVVEVKHGYFIRNERNIPKMKVFHEKGYALSMNNKSIFWTCSCCGSWASLIQKYCSECGAKMDGGKVE